MTRWLPGVGLDGRLPEIRDGSRAGLLFCSVFAAIGLGSGSLQAQLSLEDFKTEWRWADYGRESGFTGETVRQMVEVGDTLWTLADEGVFWFDHYSWHRAGPGEGLPDQRPLSLSATSEGRVVTVVAGQVYSGSTAGFSPLPVPGLDANRYEVRKAVAFHEGLVVAALDRELGTRTILLSVGGGLQEAPPPGGVAFQWDIWRTPMGTVWLGADHGLFFLENGEWQLHVGPFQEVPQFSTVWETAEGMGFASQGNPLVSRGFLSWDGSKVISRSPGEGGYSVLSGTTTSDGTTLVAYDSGDLRVLQDGSWSSLEIPGHRREGLHFVFSDRQGDLWFGTRRGLHLFRWSANRWTEIRFPFPDPRNRINDLLVTPEGELWMANDGGLARIAEDGSEHWIRQIRGREIGATTGLARDGQGGIWVTSGATFQGAYRYFDGRWSFIGSAEGLTGGRIHRAFTGSDGSVWFSALGSGLENMGSGTFRWADGRIERWMDDRGWLESRSYAVAEAADGSLWFGSKRGLARYRDGEWSYWGREEGLDFSPNGRVFTVLPTEEGGALVGFGHLGGGGIQEVRPDGSVNLQVLNGSLAGIGVSELARDGEGVAWASSNRGVLRGSGGEWSVIDATSGMDPERAWPLAFRENQVLIGTTGGGLQILDRSEESSPPPKVELFGPVLVEGRSFRIRWRVFSWRGQVSQELIQIRDRLPGEDWSEWGRHREMWTAGQDDFGWGRKVIELQAKGLHGQLSDPLRIEFVIPAPLHLRPLFFIPVALLGGVILALLALGVTRRRRAEEAIRESEGMLRTLVDTAPDGIAIYDADSDRFLDVNANVLAMTQRTKEEFLNTRLGGTSPEVGPDGRNSREVLMEKVEEALEGKEVSFEWVSRSEDGSRIPTLMHLVRFPSKTGRLVRFNVLDITQRKEAERKQQDLEAQLRQSQKLEAVGQLTGGVAHDFNNLLTVIMGNLDLLRETQDDPDVQELLHGAIGAAERSALLTQRLLAFSRRQALNSRPIVLKELVEGLMGLLERSLGETIRVQASLPPDLWVINVDPGQLEHAIINLSVNARDAMPRGGDLFLEGANLLVESEVAEKWGGKPGEYVCLSVTDTGIGMEPGVQERAIDPFFTTKEVGEGSGLGLSMVYGFLQQSGGFIKIYSELGRGTAVQLFLPRAVEAGTRAEELKAESTDVPLGQGETLLVVEDEPLLLELSSRLCRRLGYEVIQASDSGEAMDILRTETEVDLLFSDVVLPGGVDGVQLAIMAREIRPDLPVLFTSGYAEQSVLRIAQGLTDFQLIPKPFDSGTLAREIRAVLKRRVE